MISAFLIALGLLLIFFGALGTIILPDLFSRFHAATKCGVTGTVTVLLGLMARADGADYRVRLLFIILFILLTAPLIPHVLGVSYLRDTRDKEGGGDMS